MRAFWGEAGIEDVNTGTMDPAVILRYLMLLDTAFDAVGYPYGTRNHHWSEWLGLMDSAIG